ncbi:spermine synthase [Candidatus Bipolaricaulota bacterium]|nr:spermine synthase [Candidatus Bipolaricaulota bacterium]
MNKRIVFAAAISGLCGMVLQILLLREALAVFHGNDLSVGILLANWLVLEAAGAFFIGKRIEHARRKVGTFIVLSLLFALCAPLALYLTRIVRDVIGVMPGVGVGVFSIFYSSLLILLLPSSLHGALFVFACRMRAQVSAARPTGTGEQRATSIGRIYGWETVGHIVGAVIVTFLLIPHINPFAISFIVGALLFAASLLLIVVNKEGRRPSIKGLGALAALLGLFIYLFAAGWDDRLHHLSVARAWPGQEVVHHQHSIYGHIAVIERQGEYTFLADGIPAFTTPTPDIVWVEEFVHLPMLAHPQPENVAVLSGGAGGVLSEILKHPTVKQVDYTEIDPLLIELVRKFSTPLTDAELADPRVNTFYIDGRRFLTATRQHYDLIFVGIRNPKNLAANRLFTEEFFTIAKERLREGGILVVTLPGSLTYLSHELRNLNAVVINTLKSSFPYLHIIPGYFNIFLASNTAAVTQINPDLLYTRLYERELSLRLLSHFHIELRLAERWLDWFQESIYGATQRINHDHRPLGFFYSLAYWNAMFSPALRGFFTGLEGLNLTAFAVLFIVLTGLTIVARLKIVSLHRASVPFSIGTTGFAGMVFDLLLIFSFQTLFGFVAHWIGILIASFMLGVAAGGFVMTARLSRIRNARALFIRLEMAVGLFAILLPWAVLSVAPHLGHPVVFILGQGLFLLLAVLSGALVGVKFPLASKMHLADSSSGSPNGAPNLSKTVGLLYGTDLLGGWTGGIAAGVVLLPVLGLWGTLLVVVMAKASSLAMLITARKTGSK